MPETDQKERTEKIISSSDEAVRSVLEDIQHQIGAIPNPSVVFDAEQLPSDSNIEVTEIDRPNELISVVVDVSGPVRVVDNRYQLHVARQELVYKSKVKVLKNLLKAA